MINASHLEDVQTVKNLDFKVYLKPLSVIKWEFWHVFIHCQSFVGLEMYGDTPTTKTPPHNLNFGLCGLCI
jgi:hypothetical protein